MSMQILSRYAYYIDRLEDKLPDGVPSTWDEPYCPGIVPQVGTQEAEAAQQMDFPQLLAQTLAIRDQLQKVIDREKVGGKVDESEEEAVINSVVTVIPHLSCIIDLDKRLYRLGRNARKRRREIIDFDDWRELLGREDTRNWWWHIDHVAGPYAVPIRFGYGLFDLLVVMATILLIYISLGTVLETARRVATLMLELFRGVEFSDIGFDVFTIGAIVANLFLGGGISISVARRFKDSINAIFSKSLPAYLENFPRLEWAQQFLRTTFHVNQFFVATVFFLVFMMMINTALNIGVDQVFRNFAEEAIDVESRLNALELAGLFDEATASELGYEFALAGLQYEGLADFEQAIRLYERALSRDPRFVFARYRIADLLIDAEEPDLERVLLLLDTGIRQNQRQIEDLRDERDELVDAPESRIDSLQQRLEAAHKLEYLMLVSRGHALIDMGEPIAAKQDLVDARNMTNPEDSEFAFLFVTTRSASAEDAGKLSTVEMLAYLGQAAGAQFLLEAEQAPPPEQSTDAGDTGLVTPLDEACDAWESVQGLAQSNVAQERLWLLEAQDFLREYCRGEIPAELPLPPPPSQ